MEDPKKFHKPNKEYYNYPQNNYKARGISFFAFVVSVFIYISIFYIFNLSPSTLFNNAKFWFLISNTLILIIAADYGSFSSSNDNKQDAYDEYLAHSEAAKSYSEIAKKINVVVDDKRQEDHSLMQENKEVVVIVDQESETPEEKRQIVAKTDQELMSDNLGSSTTQEEEDIQEKTIVVYEENKTSKQQQARPYKRSKSEKEKRVVMDESYKKNDHVLRRSETEKIDQEKYDHDVEYDTNNEYLTMSDEDLNRRAEEFIQRINRQIRLQARAYNN